ncbi:MAG: trypsin-like peptidase domain-containing protein, partial [candidate division Zixibacteria bacterium]|nr:trypsin-like peptidase domain-containing protein [candidate division Zixibacteria bacterium]
MFRVFFPFLTAVLLAGWGVCPATAQPYSVLRNMERETVGLVKKIEPSVVTVIVQRKYTTTINGQTVTDYDRHVGSGVVWDRDGHILTTAGAVYQADDILISFSDGQYRRATLIGVDPLSSIAMVQVDSVSVSPARVGNSDEVSPGAWVFMLSHAFGNPSSMSLGLVNGIRQEDVLIQVSAAVGTGFTSGAVFSIEGHLIGLVADEKAFQAAPKEYTALFGRTNGETVAVIPINRVKT